MSCPSDVIIGEMLPFSVVLSNPTTGAVSAADGDVTWTAYPQGSEAPVGNGTMTAGGETGHYTGSLDTTGLTAEQGYEVRISAAVGGITGGQSFSFIARDGVSMKTVVLVDASASFPTSAEAAQHNINVSILDESLNPVTGATGSVSILNSTGGAPDATMGPGLTEQTAGKYTMRLSPSETEEIILGWLAVSRAGAPTYSVPFIINIAAPASVDTSGLALEASVQQIITTGGTGPWATADISSLALEASVQTVISTGGTGPWATADVSSLALEASVQTVISTGGTGPWTTATEVTLADGSITSATIAAGALDGKGNWYALGTEYVWNNATLGESQSVAVSSP